MIFDLDLEPLVQLVDTVTRLEVPWDAEQASSELVQSGWEPVGSVSLPFPRRLGRSGLRLGIESHDDEVVVSVTLKQWQTNWNSPDYAEAVVEEYEGLIQECRELGNRLAARLGQTFPVEPEKLALDEEVFIFVHMDSWKVADMHVALTLEHLDPDDTPIVVCLYLIQDSADRSA